MFHAAAAGQRRTAGRQADASWRMRATACASTTGAATARAASGSATHGARHVAGRGRRRALPLRCATGLSAPLVRGLDHRQRPGLQPRRPALYLSDSHPRVQRIWAFDLHADGTPVRSPRVRRHERLSRPPRRRRGRRRRLLLDLRQRCRRRCSASRPHGRLDRALRLPVTKPSMCAFGGPALDQLFVTSIIPARPADGFDAALAGAVLRAAPRRARPAGAADLHVRA